MIPFVSSLMGFPQRTRHVSIEEAVEYRDASAQAMQFAQQGMIGRVTKVDGHWVAESQKVSQTQKQVS